MYMYTQCMCNGVFYLGTHAVYIHVRCIQEISSLIQMHAYSKLDVHVHVHDTCKYMYIHEVCLSVYFAFSQPAELPQ